MEATVMIAILSIVNVVHVEVVEVAVAVVEVVVVAGVVKNSTYNNNDKHFNENNEGSFIVEDNNNQRVEKISRYIEYKALKDI
jgi:hypothetical protein